MIGGPTHLPGWPISLVARLVSFGFGEPAGRWIATAAALVVPLGLHGLLGRHLPDGTALLALLPIMGLCVLTAGAAAATIVLIFLALITGSGIGSNVPPPPGTLALFLLLAAAQIALVHELTRRIRQHASKAEEAKTLARQNQLMLIELQHRIENNLAVIGSILTTRGVATHDPEARGALHEAAFRLSLAAGLGRRLHDSSDREVDLGEILHALAPEVLNLAGGSGRVAIHIGTDPVSVSPSRALPLALVAVELLSNAIRHGFPGGEGGRIGIRLDRTGAATARLVVRHDGFGLPPGFRLSRSRGLGLTVACELAETLGANLMICQDRGVVSCLSFPIPTTTASEPPRDQFT